MMKRNNICCQIRDGCFCCQLETFAFVVGWIGVVYRTVLITFFGVLLSKTTEYDPNLYNVTFTVIVSFSAMSFIASAFLLFGIFKRIGLFLLPYLSLEIFEMVIGLIYLLIQGLIYYFSGRLSTLYWFAPIGILSLCFMIYSYILIANLYVVYTKQNYEIDQTTARIKLQTIY